MVDATIIIPTYNRTVSANICISSILSSGLNNIEIIVVDDYKKGDFTLSKNNSSPLVRVIKNNKQGVASARNCGANLAGASILIFVDDDMIVNREAILKAIDFLNSNKNSTFNANWEYEKKLFDEILVTQFGRYLIQNNFTSLKGWNNNAIEWKENSLLKSNGLTSQFFAIKKIDFIKLGGYNENFPFAGFEDHDLYEKIKKNFLTNYIDTNVLIFHNETDRVSPLNWFERKMRGAITRRVAVNMGFKELSLKYNIIKKNVYKILILFKPVLMTLLNFIPNYPFFDRLYFRIINLILGITIFEGYYLKKIVKN